MSILRRRQKPLFNRFWLVLLAVLSLALVPAASLAQTSGAPAGKSRAGLAPILQYISSGWDSLTRSLESCGTVVDPKLAGASMLYLPAQFAEPRAVRDLQQRCQVQIEQLPKVITGLGQMDPQTLHASALLYLPHRYVVPGGRFNEMYGWDSYFIIRGLIEDGRVDLARGMVENFFFEIEHYGAVLNANRAYYLTRSQPPFLTSMIFAVYNKEQAAGKSDCEWLARAYGYAVRDHNFWTRAPHLAGDTGLSRYFDFGEGPAPESLQDETGHYRSVAQYFLLHPGEDRGFIVPKQTKPAPPVTGREYNLQVCDASSSPSTEKCSPPEAFSLSASYYKGDRSMRESGYDISFRFGPYGAETQHFAPVCLNSLLYKTEKDLQRMSVLLGKQDDARHWGLLAEKRKAAINKYLWNAQRGLFFDYNFTANQQSSYEYVTTFYPLWAGLATPQQAKAVMDNLKVFEQPGGLVMSRNASGGQWDWPYAWAPAQLLSVEGMRNYGYQADADRVSSSFLTTVLENFRRDGTIREKYNAVTRSSETQVTAGYNINVIGFGWTNGVFLVFLHELPKDERQELSWHGSALPEAMSLAQ